MDDRICPYSDRCPIFSGLLKDFKYTTKMYREEFCEAGPEGREKCKRYQCRQKFGKVPQNLLPNAPFSLEDIARREGWIM